MNNINDGVIHLETDFEIVIQFTNETGKSVDMTQLLCSLDQGQQRTKAPPALYWAGYQDRPTPQDSDS